MTTETNGRVRRLRTCVESWPECEEGKYDPHCCRFPKSCSCTVYDPALVKDSDLEPSRTCAGCGKGGELAHDIRGRFFCQECCPQLFCGDCMEATGGCCREHPSDDGPEPWGPGWF